MTAARRREELTIERLRGEPPSPWEDRYGFSRVVRASSLVVVGGTTSVDEVGEVLGESAYDQAREILRKIAAELARAGATVADVIQTRAYVTDISQADEIGRAHRELFESARPAMTMVGVSALIDPRMLVEIEAVAVVG